jgi:molybdopterin-guanine dinucleotide biosynthesis protein A
MALDRLTGVVLAGGKSRRFGGDKAWALLAGRTLFDHVCRAVAEVCAPLIVVAPEGRALPPTVPLSRLDDAWPGEGPLGGMLTAFRELRAGSAFVTGCDMPLLAPAVIEQVAAARGGSPAAVAVAGSALQPLCAVYDVAACLGVMEEMFADGERSVRAFLDRVDAAEVALGPAEAAGLRSVNTPDDLEALSRQMNL